LCVSKMKGLESLLFCVAISLLLAYANAGCTVTDPQCYIDDFDRVLGPVDVNAAGPLNNPYCAQLCHNMRAAYAGTENGNQCFCGNTIRKDTKVAPASDCSQPCSGFPNETCGAGWRISIFRVDCSGAPVPPPSVTPFLSNPCLNLSQPYYLMPFCNSSLPIAERVEDVISRLTLDEKIANLGNVAAAPSIGITEPYNWGSEATHGLASARCNGETPFVTNFAFPITTAMSFNRTLWYKTGSHIGREARAMMNAGNSYSTFWAPVINLARDPRWARNLETPGEDPYLSGEYATYYIRGMQESPADTEHIQASACCKHYIANEMDDSTEVGVHHWRNEFDAHVPIQDLVDSYMVPFQACVEKGRVSGLMCSYNAVNGIPSCANSWLLNTVARQEWGFDGYVTADCDADSDVFYSHNYTPTPELAVQAVLRAGTDVDCGGFVSQFAPSALNQSLITEADIDERLRMLFRVRFRLSHFDPIGPLDKIPIDVICSDYALALSRDGTAQGSTLIKNDGVLPLPKSLGSVAVIGPNCNLSQAIAGYYGPPLVCGFNYWNMVDAVQQYISNITYAFGVPSVTSNDTSNIPDAVALARSVDAVILVVGTDLTVAEEGHDASSIELSAAQQQLIQQVAAAASNPVVVVTMTAVPLDISDLLSNPDVGAVLHVGHPSVTTLAVGDVLFGEKVPAGRLIQTIYPASYASQISIFDFNMRPGPSAYPRPDCTLPIAQCPNGTNPGRTHRFYTGSAVVPFGFGLSYTTFQYSIVNKPSVSEIVSLEPVRAMLAETYDNGRVFPSLNDVAKKAPLVSYAVNVTNTGKFDADDAVLGFLVPPGAGQDGVPLQVLFGFERVHVPVGQTVTVWILPSLLDFTAVDEFGVRRVLSGAYHVRFGVAETAKFGQGFAEDVFLAA
jgi:beta-glucosidase-like glycosyl hydrolase